MSKRSLLQLLAERDFYEFELKRVRLDTASRRLAEFFVAAIDGEIARRASAA